MRYRGTAVESASNAIYDGAMKRDLGALLASALYEIRCRTTKTQDAWRDRTGMSQSYLSAAERGTSGWESIRTIGEAIEKTGVDPIDLLRGALAKANEPEVPGDQLELLRLWAELDKVSKDSLLGFIRQQVAARAAAR